MKTKERLNSININLTNEIIWLRAFISTQVIKEIKGEKIEMEDPNKVCVLCAEILFVNLERGSGLVIQRKRFESPKLPVEKASLKLLRQFVKYVKQNYKADAKPVHEPPFKEQVELSKFA